jgi:hypothetical protein
MTCLQKPSAHMIFMETKMVNVRMFYDDDEIDSCTSSHGRQKVIQSRKEFCTKTMHDLHEDIDLFDG